MKIGFNVLLWTPYVTEEHFGLFEKLKEAGYDGVEIPLFGGEVSHYQKVGAAIKDNGLQCTSVTVIPDEEHNPISAESKHRQGAIDYLKNVIDCSAAIEAEVLCGPFYQPLGVFSGEGPTEEEKQRAAEVHKIVADIAQEANIKLAVESLNRFECYFLNTLDAAAEYAKWVDHPNFRIMYDTFHGNIEEKDPVGCVNDNIEMLVHFHVSENDRGTPGRGHVRWPQTFTALRKGGYDGWLTIEAFGRDLPDLAATTRVWRDLSSSPEECYTEGYELIKNQWEATG
jgi:D-psicose/D-tagatose/L-ribulose 3-epimerase